MRQLFYEHVRSTLAGIDAHGLRKPERLVTSAQGAVVRLSHDDREFEAINLCANNYLGLAGDARIADAAARTAQRWGAGVASVRFICGTQTQHRVLEGRVAEYLGYEDAITFAAAFDANGGVFEPLLGEADAIISDSLNHASIIDGVRLSKARRYRYANGDMNDLEGELRAARKAGARTILIATDGVFSMDGYVAPLPDVVELADRHDALVMVDDCHATGVIGSRGRGSASHHGVSGRIDILTGTFGKALGGGMGGFVAARREVVDLLRQRARPYLFSNALAPPLCGAALEAISIADSVEGDALRTRLHENARLLRGGLSDAGFDVLPGDHPIIPVMLGDASVAQQMAAHLLDLGVFVTGFSFPVVPQGAARIRTQVSAAHTSDQMDRAVAAFVEARARLGGLVGG